MPERTTWTEYPEGSFGNDTPRAYEIAKASANIQQIAGWHANSGQSEIVRLCIEIRTQLRAMPEESEDE